MNSKIAFDKKVHKPRALTRKETRALRDSGFHPNYAEDKGKIIDDMTDFILDNFYPEIDFDGAKQADCLNFAADTFKLTYGVEEKEIKNS
ncbi:MAG: hypothetical protein ABFC57_17385 [Veillonellales bacterium]